MNNFYDIGKQRVSKVCLETYPCQHHITDMTIGDKFMSYGSHFYIKLRDEGLSHPHFDKYKEYVRKIENPTPEEIIAREKELKEREDRIIKQEEERKKVKEEQDKITNKYKASSYIARLKARYCCQLN